MNIKFYAHVESAPFTQRAADLEPGTIVYDEVKGLPLVRLARAHDDTQAGIVQFLTFNDAGDLTTTSLGARTLWTVRGLLELGWSK